MNSASNLDQIRSRAQKRVRERTFFLYHLAIFVVLSLCLFTGVGLPGLLTNNLLDLLPILFIMGGWGFFLAIHAIIVYIRTSLSVTMLDKQVERETARQDAQRLSQPAEKPKREWAVSLEDDGELAIEEDDSRRELHG